MNNKTQVAVGAAVFATLIAGLGFYQYRLSENIRTDLDTYTSLTSTLAAENEADVLHDMIRLDAEGLQGTEPEKIEHIANDLAAHITALDAALTKAASFPSTPQIRDALANAQTNAKPYFDAARAVVDNARNARPLDLPKFLIAYKALETELADVRGLIDKEMGNVVAVGEHDSDILKGTSAASSALLVALAAATAGALWRMLSKMEEASWKLTAIDRSQAVIEFKPDGTILTANTNFLSVMGYDLTEIKGRHHRMFVEPEYAHSPDYGQFWEDLRAGKFQVSEFKRIGKNGKVVYIQASYNPIIDSSGNVYKVIKFASDVTEQVLLKQKSLHVKEVISNSIVNVSASIEETQGVVQSVTKGADEMSKSINDIATSLGTSKTAVMEVVKQSDSAQDTVAKLNAAGESMSNILSLIESMASQTSLLALNAAIEAARAGDAGRGFAVVADEVKKLAGQTAGATTEIAKEIEKMQDLTKDAVASLSGMKTSIDAVAEGITTVAAATEEQSSVTNNIATSMREVSIAVGTISESITTIAAESGAA